MLFSQDSAAGGPAAADAAALVLEKADFTRIFSAFHQNFIRCFSAAGHVACAHVEAG